MQPLPRTKYVSKEKYVHNTLILSQVDECVAVRPPIICIISFKKEASAPEYKWESCNNINISINNNSNSSAWSNENGGSCLESEL